VTRVYHTALATTHRTLFRALDTHLSAATATATAPLGHSSSCHIVTVSTGAHSLTHSLTHSLLRFHTDSLLSPTLSLTHSRTHTHTVGLSDSDRTKVIQYYLHTHLPTVSISIPTATSTSESEASLLLHSNIVLVESRGHCSSGVEQCLAELVNSLLRQRTLLDAHQRRHSAKHDPHTTHTTHTAVESVHKHTGDEPHYTHTTRKQNKYLRNFLPPALLLRQLYDTVTEHRAFTLDQQGAHSE
jgi:hypothetical protein